MIKYIIKRLALSILILAGVSIIIYGLVRIKPGLDFVQAKYSVQVQLDSTGEVAAMVEEQRAIYGLTSNIGEGYLIWLNNILHGEWGNSFIFTVNTGEVEYLVDAVGNPVLDADGNQLTKPVASSNVIDIIASKSKISFIIALIATILQFSIAIPLGITSATKQYGVVDYSVTVLAMMGISLPSFFLGALLLKIFSIQLGWFPYAGLSDPNSGLPILLDNLHHLVLPISVLVILSIGGLMRYTRTNMLEVLNADYIRTARAKGLSEHTVIYKHAFRNTLIPLATIFAGILPGLFGGAMITETIFSIDGIGKAAYKAVTMGDIPFVMAYNLFISVLTVIGTLSSDIMYVLVDPRVKLVGGKR
ncbi:MAG: ABC transporter permease [Candidatus Izemoplasmatales bacterium]|jgi:peptide/nickel transport system permease protein|nr:ABC transporter permease [Candidatus Izemoplasmatales bacterium]